MKKIKCLLIDVKNENYRVVEIEDNEDKLDTMYELLDCDCIGIVERKIFNKRYDIIHDDEGLLKDNPKISCIDNYGRVAFVGNLLITRSNADGETTSLTSEDIKYIAKHIKYMYTKLCPDGYYMLTAIGY